MGSGDMSRRAHLWLRLSAIAVIAGAAAIPRTGSAPDRAISAAASARPATVATASAASAIQPGGRSVMDDDIIGASVMTASAMNVLPVAASAAANLDAPLRKDAKPAVARR